MEIDGLTDEQNQALSYFREFTHIDSIETCRQYLEAHEWDVERAIETALVSNADLPSDTPNLHQSYTTDASTFDSAFGRDSSEPFPRPSAPPMSDNELPSASTRSVSNNQMNNPQNPNNSMSIVQLFMSFFYAIYLAIQSWIPWTIIQIVVSFFRSLIAGVQPVDPLKEIDDYCAYFNQKYGRDHPAFYRGRLQQALSDARREVRLLFIYLHDKNSARCDEFCREILCQDALRDLIGNHLLWSASIDTQEGLRASQVLRVRTYPCLCIVAHEGSQERLQFQMDHYTGADECLAEIFNAVQVADQTLEQNRERLNSRNSRNRLLEEQNAAYLDSMRADQEKAELRARQERERLQLEEEQRRKQEEEERKLREFTEFRDRIRRELPAEPSPTETDIIQVSIRLPSAEPMRRRFRRSDPAKLLFEYAWTNSDVPNQFELLWGYPRKRYQYDQIGEKTIGDVIHANTETCYLEQIDDEK